MCTHEQNTSLAVLDSVLQCFSNPPARPFGRVERLRGYAETQLVFQSTYIVDVKTSNKIIVRV